VVAVVVAVDVVAVVVVVVVAVDVVAVVVAVDMVVNSEIEVTVVVIVVVVVCCVVVQPEISIITNMNTAENAFIPLILNPLKH